ncbi:MAG: hypothetical protein ABFS24_12560 [Pseudomonadota bacterium]
MFSFSLSAFIKFLVGVFLLQGATVLLVMTVQDADLHRSGWLVVALGILIGMIAALWFSAISSHASQHSFVRASEKFNRQRDYLRRQAEKEKTKEIRDGHRQVLRETRRVQNRSTLKLGVAMAGIAGLGVLLLFTQFMTLGLLAVSATGGALLGYGFRARQGRLPVVPVGLLPGKQAGHGEVQAGEKAVRARNPD